LSKRLSRGTPARLLRALLPSAEADEVIGDLEAEHDRRARRRGPLVARLWLWMQVLGSLPPLVRRTWWRGWTGFEPRANWMRPGGPMFESWIMDARYAGRRLLRRPAYALLAVLTLALGAGGTAAIFSVVRTLLLDPLPIAREEQVGVFWFSGSWTEQEFLGLRPEFPGFARVAAYRPEGATLQTPGEGLRMVEGVSATAELFDVLGAPPLLGRTFAPGEDLPGSDRTVVISHGLWQELGADATVVGRPLILGGTSRTVIGVMPPGFWFPSPATQVWLASSLSQERRVGEYTLIGRIAPGLAMSAMEAPLKAIAGTLGGRYRYPPKWDKTIAPALTPVRDEILGDVRPGLVATFVAMALIMLIACVNVAMLMLGQVGGRSTELAVRRALGADRTRLLQQLVVEAVLIGVGAGALGALIAAGGFGVLVRSLPLGELAQTARLDWTLLWAATLISLAAAVLMAGLSGTVLWRGGEIQGTLQATRTGGVSVRGGRLEGAMVVAQIALAVLLASGAGLLIRSVANLRGIDPGVNVSGLAVIDVTAPTQMSADERRRAYIAVLPSLRGLPGVRDAAATQRLPLRGSSDNWGMIVDGKPEFDGTSTFMRVITPDYFQTMGIQVKSGRGFTPGDTTSTERLVVVNEAFVARFFPGEDAIGRTLNTRDGQRGERIIGVVNDVAEGDLTDAPAPSRYMLYEHVGGSVLPGATLVLRATSVAGVATVIQAARQTLRRDAPQLAVQRTMTMQSVFDEAVGPTGQVVVLVSLLAGLALVLGAVGVYGVISHYVARRSRDYGICIALGLHPRQVMVQVVRRGLALVVIGSVIGVGVAVVLTNGLASLLYDVEAADPLALAGAVVALMLVGTVAALLPARRASLTDPAVVLRQQ
jgi:putative ABC transport system permease protein